MARRTSILIDDALLEAAQRALGTTGITPTIEAALHAAIRGQRRRQLLARLRDPDGFDDHALAEARQQWYT